MYRSKVMHFPEIFESEKIHQYPEGIWKIQKYQHNAFNNNNKKTTFG